MAPFFVLLSVPIFASPFMKNIRINRYRMERLSLFFFFAVLTLLVMLRHPTVGNDTEGYIYFYRNTAGVPWHLMQWGSLEVGFQLYMKLVSMVSSDPQFFLAVSGLIVSALIYPTYRRLCVDPSLTVVLFCTLSTFVMMFSGIRQMMAVGIGCLAYEFTRRHKLVFFILAAILAMLFHTSAFILFFMYPLYHVRITKKLLIAVVPILVVIFIFNRPIFSVIGPLLGEMTRFDVVATSTGAYSMIILFLLFAVFCFLIPDDNLLDDEMIGLRNLLLLSLIIQFFAPLNFLVMRLNYYFIILIPLTLPKMIQYRSVRWNQVAIVGRYVMLIFFLLYFFYNAYTSPINLHVFPYYFFWENVVI